MPPLEAGWGLDTADAYALLVGYSQVLLRPLITSVTFPMLPQKGCGYK